MFVKKATEALSVCELKLREALAEAASSGDYEAVAKIAAWARIVSDLAAPSGSDQSMPPAAPSPDGAVLTRPKRSQAGYPRFVRTEDALAKIGWSKADRSEYQHKAPATILPVLVGALATRAKGGRVFPLEKLLPLRTAEGEVPGYQVYVWLAWLRTAGLVQQRGRQGYTVENPAGLADAANELWRTTPHL